jgi:hypothetical protein
MADIFNELRQDVQKIGKTLNKRRKRRQTIPDSIITPEMYNRIMYKVCDRIMNAEDEVTQKNICIQGLKLNLSDRTIARLVKDLIPEAKPTANSVAQMINWIRKEDKLLAEMDRLLEGGE